ncbi:alanine/glycine:cation symporter family protein [Confluentibacter citreus]|uniref:alanine/glycine:cation symporter family protein n=1 Tax=Confluentibacter citreus TaxID=2007307 RepID=UPI000C28F510|nr:alanine/glycine:cation symporter family protein [Confluentibacter citreus]
MKKYLLSTFTLLLPFLTIAQEVTKKGLDEKVNDAFMPLATWWEGFILTKIPIGEYQIPFVVLLLVLGASFFTIYFKFPSITKFWTAISTVRGKYVDIEKHGVDKLYSNDEALAVEDIPHTIRDESAHGEVSHFQALATAVSGTVGLGNIAGVAVAIGLGGPGATFWMIVCGLLGMSTKFVECTLGVKYRDIGSDGTVYGGPMYYLSKGLKEIGFGGLGKVLGILFAVLCVGASFGGGNAFQSNQAAVQISTLLNLQGGSTGVIIGILLAILVGIVIIGGIKRIAKITEKIVPFMAGLYILASLVIIFANFSDIGLAFTLIIDGAFSPMAGLGGVVGVIIVGFQRAAFSNEAGAGSAAIAHSAVRTQYPASEGVVALLEPFIDTVVICTMTALVIIFFNINGTEPQAIFDYTAQHGSSVILKSTGLPISGVDLTSLAFDSVIPHFSYVLTIAIVLFAFSTMISWSYYGLQSWKYLFGKGKRADLVYKVLFLFFVVVGAAATLDAVIKFSDAMILALVFPNMIGLFFLFPKVKQEMKRYLDAIMIKKEAIQDGAEDITKHM